MSDNFEPYDDAEDALYAAMKAARDAFDAALEDNSHDAAYFDLFLTGRIYFEVGEGVKKEVEWQPESMFYEEDRDE